MFAGGFFFGIYGIAAGAVIGMFINQTSRSFFSQGRGCGVKLLKPLLFSLILVASTSGLIEITSPDLLIRLLIFIMVIILLAILLFRKVIPESERFAKLTSNAGIDIV